MQALNVNLPKKIVLTNGVVSHRVDGKSTRKIKEIIAQYGGKIGLSSIKEVAAGRLPQAGGFALVESNYKARTERKERRFEVTEAYATAKVRGRYADFLKLIASGTETMSGLIVGLPSKDNEAAPNEKKKVLWIRHEICRALNDGYIVEIKDAAPVAAVEPEVETV